MISSNELMIGNIVMKDGEQHEVIGILHGDIATDKSEGWFPLEQFEPIPLSPEWLERYGYFRQFDGYYTKIDSPDFEFYYKDGEMFLAHSTDPNSPKHKLKIKYLHQLQNLFFILSGKQLEGR